MAYSREAIFFKWGFSGGVPANKYAFVIKVQGYAGDDVQKPAGYSRSLYDGSLLRIFAPFKPRRLAGIILAEDSVTGTANDGVEDIAKGTIAHLEAAHAATDLQVKGMADSAYWAAEWKGAFMPQLTYDPYRNYADVFIELVQVSS
jgi:hypothetical protein